MSGEPPPGAPGPPDPGAGDVGPPASPPVPYPVPYAPQASGAPDPYAQARRPRLQWILVVVGIPIGFVAGVVGSLLVINLTGALASVGGGSQLVALVVLVALFLAAVGLIVWPRTRRLGQGFVLGAAIGLVVAGGLCIPLVSSF